MLALGPSGVGRHPSRRGSGRLPYDPLFAVRSTARPFARTHKSERQYAYDHAWNRSNDQACPVRRAGNMHECRICKPEGSSAACNYRKWALGPNVGKHRQCAREARTIHHYRIKHGEYTSVADTRSFCHDH